MSQHDKISNYSMKIQYKKKYIAWSINWEFYLVLIKNKKIQPRDTLEELLESNGFADLLSKYQTWLRQVWTNSVNHDQQEYNSIAIIHEIGSKTKIFNATLDLISMKIVFNKMMIKSSVKYFLYSQKI